MGLSYLRIISGLPGWSPDERTAGQLASAARDLFGGRSEGISAEDRGKIVFVDQGEWFEQVRCPKCGTAIDIHWWQDRMDEAYATGFTNLAVRTPCCGFDTSLNDLDYHLPAGFARFVIEVRELENTYADEEEIVQLSRIAGRPMRQIAAHY
jgi:hypothetical protein